MAAIKECDIRAPHEAHSWQDSGLYNGFVPQMSIHYHYCPGKKWTNDEVRTHLAELIQTALENHPGYAFGESDPHLKIMEELWPKIVGFVQPEDMPQTFTLGGDNIPDREYMITPDRIMQIPPDPMTRIAESLEKIEKHLRKTHWRNGE